MNKYRLLQFILSSLMMIVSFGGKAQIKITAEKFYTSIDPQQEKITQSFLKTVSPKISMSDFLFSKEEKINWVDKKYSAFDSIVKEDFEMLPTNKDKTKLIDVGFSFIYDSIKKEYAFLGCENSQIVTLYDIKLKKYRTILKIESWWPGVDYALWFGNNEFALLVWQNDRKLPKSTTTLELHYYNLVTDKKRIYQCAKKIMNSSIDFWDFYFDVLYKRKK